MSFAQKLETGQIGESEIARYLIGRGWQVLPAYQIEQHTGKGPRLFGDYGQLISPDMLIFRGESVQWVEAKTKSAFTWYRIKSKWQTGIDRKHWHHYLKVNMVTPFPTWIMFLHRDGVAKDTPCGMVSPTGLFGNEIGILERCVDHESENHGHSGMVYWNHQDLKLIATLEQLQEYGKDQE
jgi:hypothetical protein